MKDIIPILFQWFTVTMLSAQTPTHGDSSIAKFQAQRHTPMLNSPNKIKDAPNSTFSYDVYADDR